jgi:hypothetical protein
VSGGHASVNGCVAGAVLGVACGFSSLPSHWIQRNCFPPITSRYICSSLSNIIPACIQNNLDMKSDRNFPRRKNMLIYFFVLYLFQVGFFILWWKADILLGWTQASGRTLIKS